MKFNITIAILTVTDGTTEGQAVVQGAYVGQSYSIYPDPMTEGWSG